MRVLIIAEAGVNHNGDVEVAKKLIDSAAQAGADIVKFQTFRADRLAVRTAPKAEYQTRTTVNEESQYEMLQQLELSHAMHQILLSHCDNRGIEFLSTGFDMESNQYLLALGVDRFKIPSGEITNLPYLRHVGALGKPIILSTGMANLGEVQTALEVLEEAGAQRLSITVLHCNTEYPTPMRDVNLRAMQSMSESLGVDVGYSDHTQGIEVPIAAVAMGAVVIEKHLTLDRKMSGPDHRASLQPEEFAAMVSAIRNIELAMGDGIKRVSQSEAKNKNIVRKSIVASRPIRAGERFTQENLAVKRPGTGISPMRWDEVVGQVARRDFSTDEIILI